MEERFTIKQVLIITMDMLRNIGTVPLDEVEHIGMPLLSAIRNLEECIKAINEDEKRQEKAETEVEDGNVDSE